MNAIEIRNVEKEYVGFKLENISFDLPKGTIVGLVGENGAGKSTMLKLIMDAIKRDSGHISVLGVDNQASEFTSLKNEIGVVLDECFLHDVLNADEVGMIMEKTYINWDMDLYNKYLNRFNLPKKKNIKEFSRGMKMKLTLSIALSHGAKLLLLDEATSGLDPMVRNEMLDIFSEFTRDEEKSILISSHIVSDLEKVCDYIAFLHKGKLMMFEEKDLILEKYGILKLKEDELKDIFEDAIIAKQKDAYGYSVLVYKKEVSSVFKFEKSTLEEIIIFLAKGENR